ncbi:gluconolaconase [Undibacterium sp. TJN25]|uniref:gluconolaconase n=1 Tax=Undibacterium sp. TJN25 TaxID=3413056 RepID=UPI003BF02A94
MSQRFIRVALLALAATAAIGGGLFAYYSNSSQESQTGARGLIGKLAKAVKKSGPRATVLGWPALVTTFAGDGGIGYADGAARNARFADPFGLAVDLVGNLYVADAGDNNRIRKITPDGTVTTLAGSAEGMANGQGAAASFNTPSGLAIDGAGNLYVADTGNNAIRKISAQGMVTTLAGDGKAGYRDGPAAQAQFNGPIGVAVDGKGNVYVADTYNDRLRLITADGQVKTLAGGDAPGYQDGPAMAALFDTPCAVAVDSKGRIYIADTKNNAIRMLGSDGQVTTLARAATDERTELLRRPQALALTHDGFLYVADASRGRIIQVSPAGETAALPDLGADAAYSTDTSVRLRDPSGIAFDSDGSLYVSDSARRIVRKLSPHEAAQLTAPELAAQAADRAAMPPASPVALHAGKTGFLWPVKPQHAWHEIVGTVGEVRGNYDGESRDHFHAGVDVQADMGEPVLAVADEKVSSPLPNWGFGSLSEGLALDTLSYIHMRVGRTPRNKYIDTARFQVLDDDKGRPARVRVKRGTRFKTGDMLGTVNRMFHVHLDYSPYGMAENALALHFIDFADSVAPHIDSIRVVDAAGQRYSAKRNGRIVVPRDAGGAGIVVDAYDQMDDNLARRRLGLYQLGYQVLHADGSPLPGFEQPLVNMVFNRLPQDREAVKIAYADSSGITVYGNAATRFLYVVTNTVRDGMAKAGSWKTAALPPGDYILRIFAADFAGNQAVAGRDLPVTIE